jgi:4-hydroxyphenylpyruvate dioxygenase
MQRSIATVSLSGPLEDKLRAAAAAGFDGVELFEPDVISCPLSPTELRERMNEHGLKVSLYQPFRDFEAVGDELLARNLRRAKRKFALMEEVGADMMLVCSSVHQDAIDDDRLAADQLCQLADCAAEHGIRIAYEALAWGRHVDSFEHSWRIVQAADHENLGVCLDSFHILAHGDDPRPIAAIPGDKIFFVQLADAPRLAMDVLQWSRHHRSLPGQGAFDLAAFVEYVVSAGYQGPLSLEVFNDVLRQADSERTAIDAMRSLLALEDAVARLHRTSGSSVGAALRELPPPPSLGGFAFVELAVDLVSETVVERLLAALGFEHSGVHRSKPVELWRNGDSCVVLNRNQRPTPAHAAGIAEVSTLAVESPDPDGSTRRGDALLAPRLARRRGPREAELSAITAPDGISVFTCRSANGHARSWLDDFIGPDLTHVSEPELTGIDHVALSQRFECFDETFLFYRTVFSLQPQVPHELAAPHGLMRSRALASQPGGVRIVLNVPLLGGGVMHPPDVQHVAFGCRDIFAAAEAMQARGMPVLPITDNYYDDLAARLGLADDVLVRMRDLGICYDRDATGEFLHFYTPLAGARLFFEVVERRGDYDGYGAANSVVRMAAQSERVEALRAG